MPDIDFQKIELNLIPKQGDKPVVFYASQYETARPFIADLFWGESEFAPGDSCWAEIDIRKVDDNLVVITDDVSIDNNEVSVVLPEQAVTCVGKNFGQIKIFADDDNLVAALNFILEVQPDPLAGGVTSESAIDNLTTQIDDIISGEGYVKDTDLDVLQSDWDEADPTSPAYIKNKPSSGTQVQADWDEVDTTSPAYIQNKPTLATVATTGDYDDLLDKPTFATVATSGSYNDLTDKPTIPAAQVQSDYAQTNSGAVDFIKNKPELPFEDKGQYLIETTPATKRSIEFTTLIGGTCGVNQLVQNGNFADTSNWSPYDNNKVSFSVSDNTAVISYLTSGASYSMGLRTVLGKRSILGHKYLIMFDAKVTKAGMYAVDFDGSSSGKTYTISTANAWEKFKVIANATNGNQDGFIIEPLVTVDNGDTASVKNVVVIDLTAYFGTSIADYVYTLESGTAGAGITWLKANGFFGADYYPYNAGGLLSVKTSKKINRDADNNIIGEYPLDDIELRGILKLDGSNNLYYDGDTYQSNGSVTRKYGIVDLGSLSWNYESGWNAFKCEIPTAKRVTSGSANAISANFISVNGHYSGDTAPDMSMAINTNAHSAGVCTFRDNSFSGNAPAFKTAMDGVYLVYELATPTTETADAFTNPQLVDGNGTEQFVDGRTVEMPVGNDTFYIPMN